MTFGRADVNAKLGLAKIAYGRNIHYINWTNNMDQFLALLPFLSFKGHNLKHTAAEGLAEALGMFPRERMTEKEYFECERHCILVATGEPVAERMLVPLPRVHNGKFIHGQIRILLANFLDVARMFVPGNSLDKSTPIMDYGNGQITVLLSNNFKEAKNVHYSKGIESVKTTTSIPINFSNSHQGDRYSASSMNIGQPSIQGFQNVRRESASKLPLVAPQVTSEMHAPSTGCFVPMDSFAELMSLLSDDNNDYQQDQPRKKSKTSVPTSEEEDSLAYLFQLDQPVSLDEILGQGQSLFSKTQVGGESSQVLRDIVPQSVTRGSASTIQLTSNSSERMNISISPGIVACTSSGSSNGLAHELGGNMGVVNPMFSSELNCLNSSLSLPQNNPKFWPAGSNALFPPQTAASFGDSTFLNTIENSNIQFESSSFPMLQYGSASAESSSSDFGNSLTQFQYPNSSVNPYDCASVGPIGSSIVGDRAGGSTLDGNSFSQFQPPSFPVHRYGSLTAGVACASASTDAIVVTSASAANGSANLYGSRQQFTKRNQFEMRGIDPLGVPSAMVPNPSASPVPIMPQCNQTQLLPRQPFLPDFQDFMPAWEDYISVVDYAGDRPLLTQKGCHAYNEESASTVPQVMPAANETNGFSPSSSFLPKNDYEDIIAFLTDDNENSQQEQARKKSKTLATTSGDEDSLSYLFQLDQPVSLEEILGQGKTLPSEPHLGGSSSSHYVAPQTVITNTRSTIQLNPNSSERIDISVSTGIIVPNASNSTFSLPQNNPKFWPAGSNAFYAPETGTSFADSIFPKTTRYSFTQFESPSFPVQPYGCAGASASGLVGNYETQLQSPSLVHPYAGPSVGSGVAANNLDGNSLTQFQSPRPR
ncbi:hypothetical protein VIGAN_01281800 [Vigna angularis var. angularis]|uniref:Mediator of RNA polymerase II transcription subunit 25 von Willebrand factor type A domain-containing protein n=1 Tax=Vigna angularis var. angularis TaxID=157739 RepID=A0A0S3R3C5_PHAAN|nr:hypothetical protein VIGAN_01281800 [Vigna angularis var. angularis]